MITCPVCDSRRVVIVVAQERPAFCARCGSRWIQDGSYQRAVRATEHPALRSAPVPPAAGGR